MRFTLVYPPNRNIPAAPYGALPLLAGCVGRDGHEVGIVDANLEVFERLLQPETIERAKAEYDYAWGELHPKTVMTPDEMRRLQALANLGVVPFERLMQGHRAGDILRDKDLFRDPDNVNWAYDTIAGILRVLYALNPLFYGLHPDFNDQLFGYLEGGFQNPISQIVDTVVLDKVLAQKPDVVGMCIPFNEQLVEGFSFMKQLKERAPDVKIVVGGAIISAFHEKLATDPRFYRFADYAMPGEADLSLPALITAIENDTNLDDVANLYWRDKAGEVHKPAHRELPNLNDIAHPDFTQIPVQRYFLPEPAATYQTSRGCYYGKCTFCSFDIKQNFRFRKNELVIEDILKIQKEGGVRHFTFWDPLTPPRLMKAIARWNKERPEDEKIFWGAETKFEKIFTDQNFTDLLYEGGARFMQFGFESGSQRMLDAMVKGNDLSRVDKMLGALKRSDIAVSVQWFIGFPGETKDEAVRSYTYLDEHRDAIVLSSYMGKFTLSPDDDIFRSDGDLYDVDIYQEPDGRYDFRYRDGDQEHYDREDLHAAYLARGDAESITRLAFFMYLTQQPERVREICGWARGGPLPLRWEDLAGTRPVLPEANFLANYDFDMFTPPEKQGMTEAGSPRPATESFTVFVTQTQLMYSITRAQHAMLKAADGSKTVGELLEIMGGDTETNRDVLFDQIRRGILTVPALSKAIAAA